ncbi:MBL fold metallo-hydrolase [Pelosinus propionicus]|uniref:L-ascorbate metabolism protein UlaG, beta-lactamase superfamily n=1 Tax=Pelosinus propionicus DSM 13327 TaxID=1123291 RepID=A0A1I4H2Z2_9FIRM|nr:MBL fold metallo-hydrolase [Pelosinus propionicus]SFL36682.1 L-ascorbate metabolism protein UlaG, beta-lactamase superfamily [Pelosinus propionicus DSM 13327]
MNPSKAKITYLFHSGYAVETANHFIIFDYYQPFAANNRSLADGVVTGEFLKNKKNVMVFSSHAHADHFDPTILKWEKDNPNIHYILSSDIQAKSKSQHLHSVSAYEQLTVDNIAIETFGSTDQGISFLIQADGISIFHAGDLNWWHWSGETKEERDYAEKIFKAEMMRIEGKKVDVAFFPVDRRLEEAYCLGAEYFAGKVKPKLLLPMHFGNDYDASKDFTQRAKQLGITTTQISHKGQEIIFSSDK